MILVADIFPQIQSVLGQCPEDIVFAKLNEAVDLLKNTGLWDPLVGRMDITCQDRHITLPDDVEVPLAINIGGQPSDYRNKWYEFHLNGPGSECCSGQIDFGWIDQGDFVTFRDPHRKHPATLAAVSTLPEAPTANLRVFGYDDTQTWIMTPDATGTLVDGVDIPIIQGARPGSPQAQKFLRITRVIKPLTRGFVSLYGFDDKHFVNGALFAKYRPSDTEPTFRRITISGNGCDRFDECTYLTSWVRMRFRRKFFKINSQQDQIPLHSSTAVKMAVQAVRKYEADLPEEYQKYFQLAVDALRREQKSRSGPNQIKIQFANGTYASEVSSNMI